ncbi:MAG: riboflavin biosynthesis protein RibF [Erysipelothrix sp.]|jgi:riboflavin kinase/FMN adenylyltransferase|nr:riboflavin biosynthesis protein RibF [Erysipelothrix sp.]
MKQIFLSLDQKEKINEPIPEPIAACIGYFDGFHLGHMGLIERVKEHAKADQAKRAMISFHPDPWVVLKNQSNVTHLTTLSDRVELARAAGIDYWIIIQFTKALSQLTPQAFVDEILCALPLTTLVVGFDFRFGHKGAGDAQFLKDKVTCFKTDVVEQISDEDNKISSTRISGAVVNGNFEEANRLLGRPYKISGTVVHGKKRGREIGFPTANVDFPIEYLVPAKGVYVGKVQLKDEIYDAMINVGHNPTFNIKNEIAIEAFIFDFNELIYGHTISVLFYHRIRDEIKFDTIQQLIDQMNEDYFYTRAYFKENPQL